MKERLTVKTCILLSEFPLFDSVLFSKAQKKIIQKGIEFFGCIFDMFYIIKLARPPPKRNAATSRIALNLSWRAQHDVVFAVHAVIGVRSRCIKAVTKVISLFTCTGFF